VKAYTTKGGREIHTHHVLVKELCHYYVHQLGWKRGSFVYQCHQNVCHMKFDLLGEIMADKGEKVTEDIDHQLLGVRKITDENNTLHSGQGFKEMEVLIVVWRV
jgi:hypothetical protein